MAHRMSVDVESDRQLDGILLHVKSLKLVNLDFTACLWFGCTALFGMALPCVRAYLYL